MEIRYDKEVDILMVAFSKNSIEESDEEKPGIILDYDKNGGIVSIEILDASKRVADPEKVELFVSGGVSISPVTAS